MTELIKIIGVAFITAVAAVVLRVTKPELSFIVTVTGIIVILLFIAEKIENTLVLFSAIANMTGMENGLLKLLLKIVGVGYISEFGAGILNDFGGNSLADKVTLAGKVIIVTLSLPIVETLLKLVQGFLQIV